MIEIATWTIELNCECPKCKECVDLLDYADFWDGRRDEQVPIGGKIETVCPSCGEYIEVIGEY